ncbi:MAG: NADH-quinone oxidoreductase subunit J [Rhodospirillales bacterium]|nr:NADH-quinone oxidoreductase subunit J [Rhodospirillales bacterium]USO07801.1 MAG: NADH-quinone oxidoreductase subunit J [Rhodospirillales bacterium]
MIAAISFYLFAFVLILSALLVISAKNPVHSVLFLILAFFNAAGLFVLLGAEFVAFILAIVYVGAVAVLFLFVVMMLDISFVELRRGAMQYVPLGIAIGAVLLGEMGYMMYAWEVTPAAIGNIQAAVPHDVSNTHALGRILYTQYALPFQIAGLVLLVAMIGAIVLTLRVRGGVRRQKVADQVGVRRSDVVELRKVQSGQGVNL